MAVLMPHHRFTVDEYEEMVTVGILTKEDRVELIYGEIFTMSPIGARHVYSVAIAGRFLTRQAPEESLVLVQSPLRLPNDSEPQPDAIVLRPGNYRRTLPTAGDALIVIEVSDTTHEYDRGTKLPLYAGASIPEAWIVDLVAGRVERHTDPGPNGYQRVVTFQPGSVVESTVVPTVQVPVDDILGLGE